MRALASTQAALKQNVGLATRVGRKLFPSAEVELIAELPRRDLPFYTTGISPACVAGVNQFGRDLGISGDVPYRQIVAPEGCG